MLKSLNETHAMRMLTRLFVMGLLLGCSEAADTTATPTNTAKEPIATPSNLQASIDTVGEVGLSWSAISSTVNYQLQYAATDSNDYAVLYTGTQLAFTHVITAGTYSYKVRACALEDTAHCSSYSVVIAGVSLPLLDSAPPQPNAPSLQNIDQKVLVTWNHSASATHYYLDRSSDALSAYATVYSGSATSFLDTPPSGVHRYRLRACTSTETKSCSQASTAADITIINPSVDLVIDEGRPTTALNQLNVRISAAAGASIHAYFLSNSAATPAVDALNWVDFSNPSAESTLLADTSYTISAAGTRGYVSHTLHAWVKTASQTIVAYTSKNILQTSPIDLSASDNPLASQQWYLANTGQKAYAHSGGVASSASVFSDLNMQKTQTQYGIKGYGVRVHVIDDGLDIRHADFAQPLTNQSEDYADGIDGDLDPSPSANNTGSHGTSAAGIFAMVEANGVGGVGIAPAVFLSGDNFLQQSHQSTTNQVNSLTMPDVDIFNMSYGLFAVDLINRSFSARNVFLNTATTLREGKGALYIKSAGNGFVSYGDAYCDLAEQFSVSCQNASFDESNNFPQVIVAAAANANGVRSSYSTAGPNVWITGFGGEFGNNWNALGDAGIKSGSVLISGPTDETGKPAMITTDSQSCSGGYARKISESGSLSAQADAWLQGAKSSFNYSYANPLTDATAHTDNADCDYVNTFNGTSAAAPSISGVVALILQANPELHWREVKDILAKTARLADRVATTNAGYTLDQGSIENAAGFKFDNWYGFGMVDVDAAVTLAFSYPAGTLTGNPSIISKESDTDYTIPDVSTTGATSFISIVASQLVEFVTVELDIDHYFPGDLAIYLVSPSGTEHQLVSHFSGVNNLKSSAGVLAVRTPNTNLYQAAVLASNAFYMESSWGDWHLKIVDAVNKVEGSTSFAGAGTLTRWKINLHVR